MQEILHELSPKDKPFESKLRALSWQFLILGWTLGYGYNVWKCGPALDGGYFAERWELSQDQTTVYCWDRLKSGTTPPVKTNWLGNSLS